MIKNSKKIIIIQCFGQRKSYYLHTTHSWSNQTENLQIMQSTQVIHAGAGNLTCFFQDIKSRPLTTTTNFFIFHKLTLEQLLEFNHAPQQFNTFSSFSVYCITLSFSVILLVTKQSVRVFLNYYYYYYQKNLDIEDPWHLCVYSFGKSTDYIQMLFCKVK